MRTDNNKKKKLRWIKHYNSEQKILLVGEGDLSFSACLARAFGSGLNMVSTSLHSHELLKEKYQSGEANVEELERLGCLVLHEVDVKEMRNHPILKRMKFDVVVFNFPHAGHFYCYTETDEELIQLHKELLVAFFLSAGGMVNQGGEVHVSHRDDYPYNTWGLENVAEKCAFKLKEKVHFQKRDYPGYENVRGGDINCYKTFPINSRSFTYKFCLNENYDHDQLQRNSHDDAFLMAFRSLVMQKRQYKLGTTLNKKARKKKKGRAVEFEVGDFVLAFLSRDLYATEPDSKLAGRAIGPYEIVGKIEYSNSNLNSYRLNLPSHICLNLPSHMRTFGTFTAKHLIPYRGDRDRWCEESVNLGVVNSIQHGEDDADLIGCRYMDWFEHHVAKYKQSRGRHWWIRT